MKPRAGFRGPVMLLAGLLALAALFALVEIQIEGSQGWAAGLPTWRVERSPWLEWFWGGRALTGYHASVFPFMALAFHFGFLVHGRFSWRLEARVLGALALFWIAEDFLWFVMNPAYGLAAFRPGAIPWHKRWILGVPTDYPVFTALGAALLALSYRPARQWPWRLARGARPA
jgi:hypothetical protein